MSRAGLLQLLETRAAAHWDDVILHALDVASSAAALDMTHEELDRLHRPGAAALGAVASSACSSSSSPDPAIDGP